jgi:hypothetical protein
MTIAWIRKVPISSSRKNRRKPSRLESKCAALGALEDPASKGHSREAQSARNIDLSGPDQQVLNYFRIFPIEAISLLTRETEADMRPPATSAFLDSSPRVRPSRSWLGIILIPTSMLVFGCKSARESSQLNWGMMQGMETYSLFNIEPNHAIHVCDESPVPQNAAVDNIVLGISSWAKTIGRDGALTIAKSCPSSGAGDGLVRVSLTENSKCGPGAGGCASSITDDARDFKTVHLIELNPKYATLLEIALHETGHAWGNCDRYAPNPAPDRGHGPDRTAASLAPARTTATSPSRRRCRWADPRTLKH